MTELKIKRGVLFLFGLVFFLFPSNNWYSVVQANYREVGVQPIEIEPPIIADYPINFTGMAPPSLTARAVVVLDRDSAVTLYAKEEKIRLLPASTVKLMTVLVSLDYYRLDDVLTANKINGQGQDMDLTEGEIISVENLLYGVLVASANDAAALLAQYYPGGIEGFVRAMNEKAKALNLNDSYFANPTGLDSDEKGNFLIDRSYSTAIDLARLANEAIKNEVINQMVGITQITVADTSGKIKHPLYTINELLYWLPGMKGVKTGWTEDAGECLVGYVERNGRGIITVVLGSEDRFGETAKLIDWTFINHKWEEVTPSVL